MMDPRSEAKLVQVHPDLIKVLRAAPQTPQPFRVIYGLRTIEAERQALATGHSETLHSRHFPNKQGYCCAVDVWAMIGGKPSPAEGHEEAIFGQIAAQIQAAAAALQIPIQWGGADIGAWTPGVRSTFHDWGHFQLTWARYP